MDTSLVLTGALRTQPVEAPVDDSSPASYVVSVAEDKDGISLADVVTVADGVVDTLPEMVDAARDLVTAVSQGNVVGAVAPFCGSVVAISDACENVIAPACGMGTQLPFYADAALKVTVAVSLLAIACALWYSLL